MKKIYVLSGPVQSGKTTQLFSITHKINCDGILQPVIDGKRFYYHISSRKLEPLSYNNHNEDTCIRIGMFSFSGNTFAWAKQIIKTGMEKKPEWFIIDEFGRLELEDKGLQPEFSEMINNRENYPDTNLLIVIRDYLFDSFMSYHNLSDSDIEISRNVYSFFDGIKPDNL